MLRWIIGGGIVLGAQNEHWGYLSAVGPKRVECEGGVELIPE